VLCIEACGFDATYDLGFGFSHTNGKFILGRGKGRIVVEDFMQQSGCNLVNSQILFVNLSFVPKSQKGWAIALKTIGSSLRESKRVVLHVELSPEAKNAAQQPELGGYDLGMAAPIVTEMATSTIVAGSIAAMVKDTNVTATAADVAAIGFGRALISKYNEVGADEEPSEQTAGQATADCFGKAVMPGLGGRREIEIEKTSPTRAKSVAPPGRRRTQQPVGRTKLGTIVLSTTVPKPIVAMAKITDGTAVTADFAAADFTLADAQVMSEQTAGQATVDCFGKAVMPRLGGRREIEIEKTSPTRAKSVAPPGRRRTEQPVGRTKLGIIVLSLSSRLRDGAPNWESVWFDGQMAIVQPGQIWKPVMVSDAANAIFELLLSRGDLVNSQRSNNLARLKKVLRKEASHVKGYVITLSRCLADVQDDRSKAWARAKNVWRRAPRAIQAANAREATANWVLYPSTKDLVQSLQSKGVNCCRVIPGRICNNTHERAQHVGYTFAHPGESEAALRRKFELARHALRNRGGKEEDHASL
jgi:hypothetical protein